MNNLKKIITIAIGLLYVMSGLLKLMDSVGTGLIVEAYFRFMHLHSLMDVAKVAGVLLGLIEATIGLVAVLGLWRNLTRIAMFMMQVIFTMISLALVIWNPQMHCGCFGEAIHLTHWQTLIKNIVLMGMLWFAYVPLLQLPNAKMWQYIAFASSVALMAGFAVYSWYFIPVIDFTDYKKGTKIVSQSEYWKLSEEEKENRATLPMLGIGDITDPDITNGEWAIISIYDISDSTVDWIKVSKDVYALQDMGYNVALLISSTESNLKSLDFTSEHSDSIYLTDKTTAISLNRKNGGITLMKDGLIINKLMSISNLK